VIKEKDLKITPARLAIFETLFKIKHPETAQEIYKKLKNIDLVTLYRTLDSFEKRGLVRKVDLHKDAVYYEFNTEHHHHIVCTKCGTVEDFKLCNINLLTKKIIKNALNFKVINEHCLELFGICNACVNK
jgi:Fur family peroxide stress response transcriptional regulator